MSKWEKALELKYRRAKTPCLAVAVCLMLLLAACAFSAVLPVASAYADDVSVAVKQSVTQTVGQANNGVCDITATATVSPSTATIYKYTWCYQDEGESSWHSAKSVYPRSQPKYVCSYAISSAYQKEGRRWKCQVWSTSKLLSCEAEFSLASSRAIVSGAVGLKGDALDLEASVSPVGEEVVSYTWQRKNSDSSTWTDKASDSDGHCHPILDDNALNSVWKITMALADGNTVSREFTLSVLEPEVSGTSGLYGGSTTVSASVPSGTAVDHFEWLYRDSPSEEWTALEGESGSSVNLDINDANLARAWKVVVAAESGGTAEKEFSLSYDSFAVSYENIGAGTAGSIVYEIIAEPDGSAPGEVRLKDGSAYAQSESSPALEIGNVEFWVGGETRSYVVTSVDRYAFKGNVSLRSVKFCSDLTGVANNTQNLYARSIGKEAFAGCENLKSVEFSCSKVNGVGDSAFDGCSALESVSFADGLEIYSTNSGAGIGSYAFRGCTSLRSISIPVITCAQRKPDFYSFYGCDSATVKLVDQWFSESGYKGYWHNSSFGVLSPGVSTAAFANCDSLESVDFKAGNVQGLFAYWTGGGSGLGSLASLKYVVFETSQPYYGDPNRSLIFGKFQQLWGYTDSDTGETVEGPDLYYAVDFYVNQADVDAADASGSSRYARVEYKRNTPTSLIQKGTQDGVDCAKDYECPDSSLYVSLKEKGEGNHELVYADGTTPDPKAVAVANGLDTDDSSVQWVWHLTGTQSRREGLTDSCKAYLVRADDLSAGRLGTDGSDEDQIASLYELCDQNLSQGSIQDSAFDYERYYGKESSVNPGVTSTYSFDQDHDGSVTLGEGKTAWFDLGTKLNFLSLLQLYDGKGTRLDITDSSKFSVSFQQYNSTTGVLENVSYAHIVEGPLLLTVVPENSSGYNADSCLQEWVLVRPQAVTELLTTTAAATAKAATCINGGGVQTETFDESAFSTGVSSGDPLSALLAVSYAGLSRGEITVSGSEEEYGFTIDSQGIETWFSLKDALDEGDSVSDFALQALDDYAYKKDVGYISCESEWGDTAVLVDSSHVTEAAAAAAAYSYAKAAPVLYTEDDGTVSDAVRAYLKGFKNVVVIGGASTISDDSLAGVISDHGKGCVTRIAGAEGDANGNACSLSIAVAEELTGGENAACSFDNVAIVLGDGEDLTIDVAGALNFSGHRNGVTLVVSSTSDAKRVAQYLRDNADEVGTVRVFGRTIDSSTSLGYSDVEFVLAEYAADIWDQEAEAIPVVGSGDTLEISGVMFEVGPNNGLTALSDESGDTSAARKWGTDGVGAGTYLYDGVEYALAKNYAAADKTLRDPIAITGLTYNGEEQFGLTGMLPRSAYDVNGGSATEAGDYEAEVAPKKGYVWKDGTTVTKKVKWSIGKATLKGCSVTLEYGSHGYTGSALTPKVASVKLSDGSTLPESDYIVSYSDNIAVGTATVTVTAAGASLEQSQHERTFAISAASLSNKTITLEYTSHAYTGAALTPKVTVTSDDGSILPADNYTVSYSDNVNAGTATVTVSASGDNMEAGQRTLTFEIEKTSGDDGDDDSGNGDSGYSGVVDDGNDSDYDDGTGGAATSSKASGSSSYAVKTSSANQGESDLVDGWKMFYAPGGDDSFTSTEGISGLGASPLGVVSIAVCCLAFCAAVAYATRVRKETNDILPEEQGGKRRSGE